MRADWRLWHEPVDVAILFLVGLLGFWLLGGFVARVGGLLLVFAGAANLALSPQMGAVMVIGVGAAMWLLGHWHYALRHQAYKSPLARYEPDRVSGVDQGVVETGGSPLLADSRREGATPERLPHPFELRAGPGQPSPGEGVVDVDFPAIDPG